MSKTKKVFIDQAIGTSVPVTRVMVEGSKEAWIFPTTEPGTLINLLKTCGLEVIDTL